MKLAQMIGPVAHLRRRGRSAILACALIGCVLGPAQAHGAQTRDTGPLVGNGPEDLRLAYDLNPLYAAGYTGQGQTIAFIEVDGYSVDDLWRYTSYYHLPPAHVTRYTYDTRQGYHAASKGLAPGPEATMDLEWAHAIAPGAHLDVFEIPSPTVQSVLGTQRLATMRDALAAAVKSGAGVISISLGASGLSCITVLARLMLGDLLNTAAQHNTAVFAASGDSGDSQVQCGGGVGTSYPASDPNVTAVGGTSLHVSPTTGNYVETAWGGSGGGLNTSFRRPSWQNAPGLQPGVARALPDVAFLADPLTGVAVAIDGAWHRFGGTSLGAPCWAGIWAIARQYAPALRTGSGGANPQLYALARSPAGPRAFHDITQGSNGTYKAARGWDFVTGLGTPDASLVIAALAGQSAATP